MIAPVNFASLPDDLVGPVNDVTGLLPEDGAPYNVDQWDGYTADRRQVFAPHPRPRRQGRAVRHRRHPLRLGLRAAVRRRRPTRVGDSAGVEFVCSSVTSNNLKDITGSPPRTTSVAVEEGIKANNRHVKYLNFDDHGFSVLDLTPQRAQMDWFVISDRADRDATITARGVVGDPVRHRPDRGRRPAGRGRTMSATAAPHQPAYLRHRRCRRAAVLLAGRHRRPRRPRGRKRAYVLVVDGCRPDEITPGLTPTLAALRDGGLDYPRASSLPVMETIPNHVMMMTGAAARPHRRAGQRDLRPRARRHPRHGPAARHPVPHRHRPAQPGGLHDRDGAEQGVPLRHLRRPGHAPLGAAADRPGLRARARRVHHGRHARR